MEKTYKFELPQNKEVENTKVYIKDGKVFIDVEFKEKFQPKDGDFLVSSKGNIFIYNGIYTYLKYGAYCGISDGNTITICNYIPLWTCKQGCRFATPKEKADFLARLEKECRQIWNEKTKQLEDSGWKPKEGEEYYFVDYNCKIKRTRFSNSLKMDTLIRGNNCFKTEEAATKVADQIKEIFKNSKAE